MVRLMIAIGANGEMKADYYRNWPVFRGLRTNEKFAAAFERVFGSRLLELKKTAVEITDEQTLDNDDSAPDNEIRVDKTVH